MEDKKVLREAETSAEAVSAASILRKYYTTIYYFYSTRLRLDEATRKRFRLRMRRTPEVEEDLGVPLLL